MNVVERMVSPYGRLGLGLGKELWFATQHQYTFLLENFLNIHWETISPLFSVLSGTDLTPISMADFKPVSISHPPVYSD